MRVFTEIELSDLSDFKTQLLHWVNQFDTVCYLDSNKIAPLVHDTFETQTVDFIVAVDAVSQLAPNNHSFELLKKFHTSCNDWIFGHFSYDLKNEIENLSSNNTDNVLFPSMFFFQPKYIFIGKNKKLTVGFLNHLNSPEEINNLIKEICLFKQATQPQKTETILPKFTKEEYIHAVNRLQKHIQQGDIYEINFCQEFYATNATIKPVTIFENLNTISPTPFAAFYKLKHQYLMCASPERFMCKKGNKLISQPIKGTIKRGADIIEDEKLKQALLNDEKERSENVMIVDLVRNDLSKTAQRGSVKVEELCGIYSFRQVHQLISTISSELKEGVHFVDAIKNTFPMGSMTGAPKISAMKLIEQEEKTKRGLYSGSVGYITPSGDFDFNVVIRSIQYNNKNQYLSFIVGSAITAQSTAEKEYEECLLKAQAMFNVLGASSLK